MTKRGKRKTGRNDPCPCGSGEKYKRCHGRLTAPPIGPSVEQIKAMMETHEAQEMLRQLQQGKGKPIISTEFAGHRVVAVGNKIHFAKKQETFIDFLPTYLGKVMGADWGNAEIKKPLEDRHQIVQWYDAYCAYQKKHLKKPEGEIQGCPMNGLTGAYLGLAYNLYLLDHNAELQAYLIRRLKQKDSFYAAYYETYVAAWFILAGFELKIENEQDSTRTHAEFIATIDGRSYSVEAKTRLPGKENLDVGNQLYKALRIEANYPRIVFIDMNVGADVDQEDFVIGATSAIRNREQKLTINCNPAPPAYVFVTNQPYHLCLEDEQIPRAYLPIGYKIPDFGHDVQFASLIDAYKSRAKHGDLLAVQEACMNYRLPITFDGELPEFAFGETERRFNIGQQYEIAKGVVGTLTTATVLKSERKAYLGMSTDDGKGHMLTSDLSNAEIAAYEAHPETFFGRVVRQGGNIEKPIDMFEFLLNNFKDTSREKMLDWFKDASDIEELKKLSDEELRLKYAERHVLSVMARSKSK